MKGNQVMHFLSVVRRWALVPALAILAPSTAPSFLIAAERIAGPAESRLRSDVTFLADDEREGRAPGTSGIEAAADYIAAAFKEAGLKPAPGAEGYFQPFSLSGTPTLGPDLVLGVAGPDGQTLKAEPK